MKTFLAAALLCLPLLAQAPAAKPAKPAPAPAPAAKPAPAPTAKPAPAPAAAGAFVGNKDSKVCHKADCKTAAKMKAANKVSFASAAEAQAQGFKACKVCKPF
ncbi:MAG: Ada metal-binding domain-containing protein [Holophagaceae bacterium]